MLDVKLLKNSVLFRLKNRCAWGNSAKGELSDAAIKRIIGAGPLGETEQELQVRINEARKRLRLRKKLIDCPQYDAIKEFQAARKNFLLRTYCNPSFIDEGLYSVKTELLPAVITDVKKGQETLGLLVGQFIDAYRAKVEEARCLGEQFNAKDYPAESWLAGAFGIDYRVVQLDIPEGLPPEIRIEEEKKLRDSFANAEQELTLALREGFKSIIDHVVDRLQPGPEGKRKRFNDTLFVDFVDFVQSFQNKNVLGDDVLSGLIGKAQAIWQSVANGSGADLSKAAKRVRQIEPVREKALAAFMEVRQELAKSIAEMPSRAFDVED